LLTALVALLVLVGSRSVLSWGWTVVLFGGSLLGPLPVALTGHSATGGAHDIASDSLVLHVLAVSLWVGGLVALLSVATARGPDRAAALGTAVPRFSRTALFCWIAVGVTGLVNALVRVTPVELFTTSYGALVLAKAAALAVLGGLGFLHRRRTVEPAAGGEHLRPRGARAAQHLQPVVAAEEGERLLEVPGRVAAGPARPVGVDPEEGAQGDAQGQAARPAVDLDDVAGAPARDGRLGLLAHGLLGGGDALAVEGGEHDAAVAVVALAVDGQEPVAEQRDELAEAAVAPAEGVGLRDEHLVVGLGAEDEDVARVEDPQREHGTVPLVGVEQQPQGIADHPGGPAQAEVDVAGRQPPGRPALPGQLRRHPAHRVDGQARRGGDGHGGGAYAVAPAHRRQAARVWKCAL
jgi:hypothetical protein